MSEPNPGPLRFAVQGGGGFGESLRSVARVLAEGAGSATNPWATYGSGDGAANLPTRLRTTTAEDRHDSVSLVRPWMMNDSVRFVARQAASAEPDTVRSIGGRLGGRFDRTRSVDTAGSSGIELEQPAEGTRLVPASPRDGEAKDDGGDSPPLVRWIFPAMGCALAYASYNIFIKKGSATINPILGAVVLQFVSALLGICLLASLVLGSNGTFKLRHDENGLLWSAAAGLAVGLAEVLSFVVSGTGVQAAYSIPIIVGGSVLFGAVLGLLVLGERLMARGWSGVGLLVTGISCVALDRGHATEMEGGPPVYWVAIALACAMGYAIYNIFVKKASASINPILGGVVLQLVAAMFGMLLLGAIIIRDGEGVNLEYDHAGMIWSCMAGIAVGVSEVLGFCVSGMGVNATQSIPIIIGGSVLFGAVLGLLVLGEAMMWPGWLGVALLTAGIGFIATDPEEKIEVH